MSNPVIISRIQNRRGTQLQFNGLPYTLSGPNSLYPLGIPERTSYGEFPDFTIENYPNVLLPGEIAVCLDGNSYVGLENGAYASLGSSESNLSPLVVELEPSNTYTLIDGLIYTATPFLIIQYSITDSNSIPIDPNLPGDNFSANGQLTITSVETGVNSTNLVDYSVQINNIPYDISFISVKNGNNIEIHYKHDFPTNLIFATNTINWVGLLPAI